LKTRVKTNCKFTKLTSPDNNFKLLVFSEGVQMIEMMNRISFGEYAFIKIQGNTAHQDIYDSSGSW